MCIASKLLFSIMYADDTSVNISGNVKSNLFSSLNVELELLVLLTSFSSDLFPTRLLMSHIHAILPILQHIVNLCLTTGDFPISCKSSIVILLIKKPDFDREMLKNYRPVSNLSF